MNKRNTNFIMKRIKNKLSHLVKYIKKAIFVEDVI